MLNVSLRAISRPALCRLWQSAHIKRVRQLGSIAFGPNEPALLNQTIPEHFAGVVSQYGDRTAVISSQQRIRLTYSQLDTDSTKLASGLAKQGIRKGDRVAVSLGNNIEFATLTYALWKLGAILVPLNPGFNAAQIISALSHLSASALIIGAETNLPYRQPRDNRGLLEQVTGGPIAQAIQSEKIPSLRRVILVDNTEGRYRESKALLYSQVYEDGAALSQEKLDADDIINIQFTSGTTSSPKAVCLTHTSILNNGNSIGDRMTLTHEDIICCPPPLFHCFGSVLGYMASATHGSAIVFPSEAFDPLAVLRAVDEESATALYGVPTMFLSELELLFTKAYVPKAWVGGVKGPAFPSLRTGIGAGSSQPIELMRRLHRDLNLTGLTICYGMTETSPVSLQTTTEDSLERRVATVGAPLPHVGVKVVDASDRNRVLPYGEKGELAVSGYLLMKGYWEDPEKTAEVMQEEEEGRMWIYTGDEACMDKEGYVQITGRIKDLIIRGGENIHPLEVENCLLAHPSVRDVSVVGVPDDRYGESVGAFIVLNQSAEQDIKSLQAHVRDHLSNHLAPKHVWFIDQLPKTESGKIKKYELRKLAEGYVRD